MSTESTKIDNGPLVVTEDFLHQITSCFEKMKLEIIQWCVQEYSLTPKQIDSILDGKPIRKQGLYDFQIRGIKDRLTVRYDCSWDNGYNAKFDDLRKLLNELKFEPSPVNKLEAKIGIYGDLYASITISCSKYSKEIKYYVIGPNTLIHVFNADVQRALSLHRPENEILYLDGTRFAVFATLFWSFYIGLVTFVSRRFGIILQPADYFLCFAGLFGFSMIFVVFSFTKAWESAFPTIEWGINNLSYSLRRRRLLGFIVTSIILPIALGFLSGQPAT